MSFLARLFGKKSQPKPVEKKATNLEALSLEALSAVINSHEDETVRIAAIQKISDHAVLLKMAAVNEPSQLSAAVQKAAKQRLATLVDTGALSGDQLSQAVANKNALFSLLGLMKDQTLFEQTFNRINDESELAQLAVDGATSKLRQLAAEKITEKSILLKLLKDTKTKDKSVFKIIKEKCDAIKEEDKRIADQLAATIACVQALELQAKRPYDAQFSAKFLYLTQQWELKKAEAPSDVASRAQIAIFNCQSIIDNISSAQAAENALHEAKAQTDIERQAHIAQLQSVLLSVVSEPADIEQTQALLRLLDAAWLELNAVKNPTANEQKTVDQLLRVIAQELEYQQNLGGLDQHKTYSEQLVSDSAAEATASVMALKKRVQSLLHYFGEAVPEVILAAQQTYQQWEVSINEKNAQLQNAQRHIGGLIRKAHDTINAGVLGRALGIRRAIDEKMQALENVPEHLANQIALLDETLAKMQDWKDYAVLPKKHELIASMESLLESKDHPDALAGKIKRLQEEWRGLTKGGKDQDQELWEKFHALAQTAYQPCKEYFAQQALVRSRNLDACKQLVEQLNDYLTHYNWSQANWSDVEKVIRVARAEWRNYTPTDRLATQPVLAQFDTALKALQQKVNDEFTRNAELKRSIIADAKELIPLEDSRKATEQVKQLQAKWQSIGASLRKEEQQLWREFRDACDAVFAKRQQQTLEFKAELEVNLQSANSLIAEVQRLTELTAQPLIDSRNRVDELRQAFGGLGQLPKAQVNDVKAAFTSAIEGFEQKIKAERVALKQQIWVNLFAANKHINEYELALVQGESPDLAELQAELDNITQWPAGGLKCLQQKVARVNAASDIAANLASLRELCVRAEILTGSETPAAEQALRTAFQVNQLQQSFGRQTLDLAAEMESLVFDWVAVGTVALAEYELLFDRFNACRLKAAQ